MFDEKCFFSRGAPAARQSGECVPSPRWAGGLQPRARDRVLVVGGEGSSGAPERRARPWPLDTFFEFIYPEKQRKHIPRVNEYQS